MDGIGHLTSQLSDFDPPARDICAIDVELGDLSSQTPASYHLHPSRIRQHSRSRTESELVCFEMAVAMCPSRVPPAPLLEENCGAGAVDLAPHGVIPPCAIPPSHHTRSNGRTPC